MASAQTPSAGVPSDVKHIRCETCESLVSAAHRRFAELRKGSKKALSEEDAMSVVETVCDPEADGGAWLRSLDLQEQGRRLRLVKQAEDGPCGVECATLRLACQALMEEGWENELGEALYGAVDADELAESACRELCPPMMKRRGVWVASTATHVWPKRESGKAPCTSGVLQSMATVSSTCTSRPPPMPPQM